MIANKILLNRTKESCACKYETNSFGLKRKVSTIGCVKHQRKDYTHNQLRWLSLFN